MGVRSIGALLAVTIAASAAVPARGSEAAPDFPELLRLFEHHTGASLELGEGAGKELEGARVVELDWASPRGGRVPATLVLPPGNGPFPTVVFAPDLAGTRADALPEALLLARLGSAALLVEPPWSRPAPWRRPLDHVEAGNDREVLVQAVVDLRRALDVLEQRSGIDRQRIALVGHGLGAQAVAIVAGVDTRARAHVLVAAQGRWSEHLRVSQEPDDVALRAALSGAVLGKYLASLAPLDASDFIGRAAPAAVLLQFGRDDPRVPEAAANALGEAASSPKQVAWYEGGHALAGPDALAERMRFLAAWLGLPRPGPVLAGRSDELARPAVLAPPAGLRVDVQRNRVYKSVAGRALRFDVYTPDRRSERERRPVVILVHGDGDARLLENAKDWGVFRSHAESLVASGLAAVVFEHRSSAGLTRTVPVAGDVDDLIDHVRERADELGVDRERIAVWVFSSGAPFGLARVLRSAPTWARAAVSYYGTMKLALANDVAPGTEAAKRAPRGPDLSGYSPADLVAKASGALPPMLVVRAGRDEATVNASIDAFLAAAQAAAVPVTLLEHPEGRHGFDFRDDDERSREVIRATYEFLVRALTQPAAGARPPRRAPSPSPSPSPSPTPAPTPAP